MACIIVEMNMMVISTYVILLAFTLKEVSSFVTRLPECKYSANYTTIRKGKYFRGNVSTTIPKVSAQQCSLYCTLNDACVFYNHKVDGTTCELLQSRIGTLEDNAEWDVVSTDYSEVRYRGPLCRFLRAACANDNEYCIDACESPGYKCNKIVNIAQGKAAKASTEWSADAVALHVVDNNYVTEWASRYQAHPWVMVDLAASYKIHFVTIINSKVNPNLVSALCIKIGDSELEGSNEICVQYQNMNGIAKKDFICKNGIMSGRYVFVIRQLTGVMNFAEVMVYAFT